jgi:proline iminopeptidase
MRIGSVDLHVEKQGRGGSPLVLVHGGPGLTHEVFKPHLERAAEFATVYFYDQRGCGRSTRLTADIACTLDDHVSDLEGLRASLGLQRMTLLGHSWGAYLSLAYSVRHERHVERLVLVSPAPPYPETEKHLHRWNSLLTSAMRREIQGITMSNLPEEEKALRRLHVVLPLYFHNLVAMDDFRRRGIRICGRVAERMASEGELIDLRPAIEKLRVPAGIVVGRHDQRTPFDYAEELKNQLYFARMHMFESSGHFPFLEQAEDFLKLLRAEMTTT